MFVAIGMILNAYYAEQVSSGIISGTLAAGISLLFVSAYKHFKYGEGIEQDERTRQVTSRALNVSWFATLALVTLLTFAGQINVVLEVPLVLSTIFFFMVFSFSALNWYYDKKGDSE